MRRLVLNAILRLGRYAVLPVVALAGAILMVWLMAIDRYTILALAAAPIVLCVATAALALALGILLLPSRRDRNSEVDEEAAPGLWLIWKELDGAFTRSGRTLLIDTNFNASIMKRADTPGYSGKHVTMAVGLPLLIILDERAIRAVIAHEVAHARLRHASGGTNLRDFIAASENVLHYADPDRTITGRIAHALLHSLLEWLEKEYRALSRENELGADAGGRTGRTRRDGACIGAGRSRRCPSRRTRVRPSGERDAGRDQSAGPAFSADFQSAGRYSGARAACGCRGRKPEECARFRHDTSSFG